MNLLGEWDSEGAGNTAGFLLLLTSSSLSLSLPPPPRAELGDNSINSPTQASPVPNSISPEHHGAFIRIVFVHHLLPPLPLPACQ